MGSWSLALEQGLGTKAIPLLASTQHLYYGPKKIVLLGNVVLRESL